MNKGLIPLSNEIAKIFKYKGWTWWNKDKSPTVLEIKETILSLIQDLKTIDKKAYEIGTGRIIVSRSGKNSYHVRIEIGEVENA